MLRITEMFCSLQGEAKYTGIPTTFIRLTGCPLRCTYCDTAYAFTGGSKITIQQILAKVKAYGVPHVTVTGGEPLAQPKCIELLSSLLHAGYIVSLETSGALDIAKVPSLIHKVLDLKTPGSNEHKRNLFSNLVYLNNNDQIKIVICNEEDYEWAKQVIKDHKLTAICEVLLSPSYEQINAKTLAEWIIRDKLPVRLQLQLHKQLWGNLPGV